MTDDSFVAELRQLKADLGPAVPMRVRWGDPADDGMALAGVSLLAVLTRSLKSFRDLGDSNPYVCLYAADAAPGARPQVVVDVAENPDVYEIERGRLVEVHGIPHPGHAVVVIVDGHGYWPAYPARSRARAPRL